MGDAAGVLLIAAVVACPTDAGAHRELAALHLREGRYAEAAGWARIAVDLDPADRHALELLAASHYLDGRDMEALEAWNRLDPVIVEDVTLGAPTRTRQTEILKLAGLERGQVLTPRALELGRRRLDLLPAASSTRLDYRPIEPGARVTAAVAERPLYPSPARAVADAALAIFTDRGLRVRVASPLGAGELWGFDWRWRTHRRRLRIGVSHPVGGPLPGILTIGGLAMEETYALGPISREERRRVDARFDTWVSPHLRAAATVAADRWERGGAFAAVGLEARALAFDDRAGLAIDGELWAAGGEPSSFGRAGIEIDWRSAHERRGVVTTARAGGQVASAAAPRTIWPGAGTGTARAPLARGHDLLASGRITGPLFGRALLYGGVETVWWRPVGPLDLGGAAFVDVARSSLRAEPRVGLALQVDVGVGLRLGLPGEGTIRVDLGRGLRDGSVAVSAGMEMKGLSAR
jgi:hypothetical protein